mmetsp:Transcript_5877/g.14544  ORF Transcript_5877/g.14544 Transcript_5877/m.14544 type:complete len:83 (-) Transcript_5877:105-353(-)
MRDHKQQMGGKGLEAGTGQSAGLKLACPSLKGQGQGRCVVAVSERVNVFKIRPVPEMRSEKQQKEQKEQKEASSKAKEQQIK